MYKMADVLYAALTVFQGYCLQYFLGNFLESRLKSRWNGMYAAALYVGLRMAVVWVSPPGYKDYKVAVGTLALSLCILSFLALCFYKAFRPVTVFLVVSFQAVSDISRYAVSIPLDEMGGWVLDILNWLAGKGALQSEKAFGIAVDVSVAGTQILQYAAIALLLYFSLRSIVRNFHEKGYRINRMELLFILTPAAVGLMICMLLRIIMLTVEDSVPEMLYYRYPVLVIVIPTILLLSLLSILYGVKLFQDMICWNREKSGRLVLEKQISSLQEHMEEMERIYSTIGKKAIVVPPELEEKMKNDPELAKSVMAKVEGFIAEQDIMNPNPRKGYLIALDENGDIAHACVTSEKMSVSSAEFIEARKAREAKHAEYERLAEESALKRKLMEQEADARYYQTNITKKAVSIAAYEAAGILK